MCGGFEISTACQSQSKQPLTAPAVAIRRLLQVARYPGRVRETVGGMLIAVEAMQQPVVTIDL